MSDLEEARSRARIAAHVAAQAASHEAHTARLVTEARRGLHRLTVDSVAGFIGASLGFGLLSWPVAHNKEDKGK